MPDTPPGSNEAPDPQTVDHFTVSPDQRVEVPASSEAPATIANGSGSSLYFKNAPDIINGGTELPIGDSVTVTELSWITSVNGTNVTVTRSQPKAGANVWNTATWERGWVDQEDYS